MSNRVDFGAMRRPTGWIAWFRLYHHGENRVLRQRGIDILFASEAEAEKAAKEEFLLQMNSKTVAETLTGPTTKKALVFQQANNVFRAKGSDRLTVIERKGRASA
ncbi:hypothetical protein ACLE20_13355 [Rhizobium sp. YIM 134829]|uniref:hypothetical protein n=1 Tax=Rhizobium sp. YIM 134829 TaxID=3390453 RepID=UPI003979E488